MARGVAVAAMVVYHSAWDLGELRLVATDIRAIPAWGLFARAIAASFLVLVGAGLVLAHGRGLRPAAFLRRLAMMAGAALAVTFATYLAMPEAYIFFGILHCIALSSILALPFLRAPVILVVGAAMFCLAAPLLVSAATLDHPILAFVGLGTRIPNTNDYVPLFPWFGFVLIGIAAFRLGRPLLERLPERTGRYPAPLRALAWVGRHSLIVYLLHQPVIFGAMSAWGAIVGRSPDAEAAPYARSFERSCRAAGQGDEACRAMRGCMVASLRREGLWDHVIGNRVTAEELSRMEPLMRACFEPSRIDQPSLD